VNSALTSEAAVKTAMRLLSPADVTLPDIDEIVSEMKLTQCSNDANSYISD